MPIRGNLPDLLMQQVEPFGAPSAGVDAEVIGMAMEALEDVVGVPAAADTGQVNRTGT